MIPLWLLAQASGPGGNRLPKRPAPIVQASRYPYRGPISLQQWNQSHLPASFQTGNMESVASYVKQFWFNLWEADQLSAGGYCRACDEYCEDAPARFDHDRAYRCRDVILKVCTLLQRDLRCVVCDTKCLRITRGVPLCCEACTDYYDVNSPQAFNDALRIVQIDASVTTNTGGMPLLQ